MFEQQRLFSPACAITNDNPARRHCFSPTNLVTLCVILGLGFAAPGHAETFRDAFKSSIVDDASISGNLRIYDFRRRNSGNAPYPVPQGTVAEQGQSFDRRGTAYGGDISMSTGSLYGFSAHTSIYTTHPLVSYDDGVYKGLLGQPQDLTQLTEGFLQYQGQGLRVRAGRQLINTPFANTDMYTLLPRSFYGVSGTLSLFDSFQKHGPQEVRNSQYEVSQYMPFTYDAGSSTPDMKLYFGRFTRSLGRFTDEWSNRNTTGYPVGAQPGLLTAGLQYQQQTSAGGLLGQAWFYNFFNIAKMGYVEAGYQLPPLARNGLRPFVRLQALHETDSGSAALGQIDAAIYGGKLGVQGPNWKASILAQYSPVNKGTFRNGGFVHPYSDLSGTLFDDTMNAGIENSGPGRAYGVRLSGSVTNNLSMFTRYVWHKAAYGFNGNYYDFSGSQGYPANAVIKKGQIGYGFDVGFTYQLAGVNPNLEGLSVSNNLGVVGWNGQPTFLNNRLRLIYQF